MGGLVSYGAYVPYHRLVRQQAAETLGGRGGAGTRAVASYDEDTTSLAVEAGRVALSGVGAEQQPEHVYLATATPAYLDKTNAAVVHAALDISDDAWAVDVGGAIRSGPGALLLGANAREPALCLLSDIRVGLPGGADELAGGDAAAAFLFGRDGDEEVIAELVAHGAATTEVLDRWRLPQHTTSQVWEERFGEMAYAGLAERALADALKRAGLTGEQLDHVVLTGMHERAVRSARKSLGVPSESYVDDLQATVGNTGTAHPGLLLARTLDQAGPDEVIAVVVLADGASVLLFRTTPRIVQRHAKRTVDGLIAAGTDDLLYSTYLSWRGLLERQPPRRPDPVPPYGPPAWRNKRWKYAFVGSRCDECGARHLPPNRVCVQCQSVDRMTPERLADVPGTISTYTVDRLAFTPSPPLVAAVIDFDGGGRFKSQLTDVDPDEVAVGGRVEMTFRRAYTARGIHNYSWKARPLRASKEN